MPRPRLPKTWLAKAWLTTLTCTALAACVCAPARLQPDRAQRLGLLALLQGFNAELLSHDSATLTLEHWCAEHHLAAPARIVAHRQAAEPKPLPDALRERLAIASDEPLRYRRVQLACGDRVLSEADNWYVPGRLSAEMNQRLDSSDEPFGKVVKSLDFERRTVSAQLLWSPLPAGWETSSPAEKLEALQIPHALLRHEAVLYSAARLPFSVVIETYTDAIFDFGDWARIPRDRRP